MAMHQAKMAAHPNQHGCMRNGRDSTNSPGNPLWVQERVLLNRQRQVISQLPADTPAEAATTAVATAKSDIPLLLLHRCRCRLGAPEPRCRGLLHTEARIVNGAKLHPPLRGLVLLLRAASAVARSAALVASAPFSSLAQRNHPVDNLVMAAGEQAKQRGSTG